MIKPGFPPAITPFRVSSLLAAALLAWLPSNLHAKDATETISSPGNGFEVGIGPDGELYDDYSGVGFQRVSDNFDPIKPGTPQEAWGISAGTTAGYADYEYVGTSNIVTSSRAFNASSGKIISALNAGTGNLLNISDTFAFQTGDANVLKIGVTVANVSHVSQAVLYRREVDWDIAPTAFHEIVSSPAYRGSIKATSSLGFENPNPLIPFDAPFPATGGTAGPGDNGNALDLNLGTLPAGASTNFTVFYAINKIGQSLSSLVSEVRGLGATFIMTGVSSDPSGTNSGVLGIFGPVSQPSTLAYWSGRSNNIWADDNWNAAYTGTEGVPPPGPMTDVIFSAKDAQSENNTVLGADFTIHSLTLNGPAPVGISGPNTLTISGSSGMTGIVVNAGAGPVTINTRLVLAGSSGRITVNNAEGLHINNTISGAVGLDKEGAGSLTLSGLNDYTGGTVIDGGLLLVDSPEPFGGGSVTLNGGTLMADPRPINIAGGYSQGVGGTLVLHVAGPFAGQYDTLDVVGHVSLGGTLLLQGANGFHFEVGDRLTLIVAGGGVSGHFAKTELNSIAGLGLVQPQVVYEGGEVLLEGAQGSFRAQAGTPNQAAVGAALDRVAFDPGAAKLVAFLDNETLGNLRHDYDLLSPDALSALYEISFAAANIQQSNLEDRMEAIRAGSTGFDSALSISNAHVALGNDGKRTIQEDKNVFRATPDNRWGVFVSGDGDFVDLNGDSNAKGYDITTGGVTLGVDYRVNQHFAIGAAFDYAHTDSALFNGGAIDADSGKGGVYATLFNGGFYADAYAGGGYNSYYTRRGGLLGSARGDTDGGEFNTFVGGGYDMHCHSLVFGPIASFQYTNVGIDPYTERGSLAPLRIVSQSQDSLRTNLGLKVSHTCTAGSILVTPHAQASWQHEYEYNSLPVDAAFPGSGSTFRVDGPRIGRDSALIEAGVTVQWNARFQTYVAYDGNINSAFQSHTVNGGFAISF